MRYSKWTLKEYLRESTENPTQTKDGLKFELGEHIAKVGLNPDLKDE